jgi:hypothetical protein
MSELREKIAAEIAPHLKVPTWKNPIDRALPLADAILAIPEIAEGQYLYSRKKVKAGKPSREPTLGHSIGTKP